MNEHITFSKCFQNPSQPREGPSLPQGKALMPAGPAELRLTPPVLPAPSAWISLPPWGRQTSVGLQSPGPQNPSPWVWAALRTQVRAFPDVITAHRKGDLWWPGGDGLEEPFKEGLGAREKSESLSPAGLEAEPHAVGRTTCLGALQTLGAKGLQRRGSESSHIPRAWGSPPPPCFPAGLSPPLPTALLGSDPPGN